MIWLDFSIARASLPGSAAAMFSCRALLRKSCRIALTTASVLGCCGG